MAEKQKATPNGVVKEQDQQKRDALYNEYVSEITPKHNWFLNMLKAFLVGGIICTLGQGLINLFLAWGFDKETAALCEIVVLVFLSVVLTGFQIYPRLAKFAGAGTVVPITGFANSVAAPAIEFKAEGQVFGIGCKIFTIAGPVILYGIFSSWLLGFIYWVLKIIGIL